MRARRFEMRVSVNVTTRRGRVTPQQVRQGVEEQEALLHAFSGLTNDSRFLAERRQIIENGRRWLAAQRRVVVRPARSTARVRAPRRQRAARVAATATDSSGGDSEGSPDPPRPAALPLRGAA